MRSADATPRSAPDAAGPDACRPAESGTLLDDGRYRLDAVIDRTSSTIRYRAFDLRLDRPVVIEEYAPAGAVRRGRRILVAPGQRERFDGQRRAFEERCRSIARIARPGTVRVYGILPGDGTTRLVTELVRGTTLRQLREERREPLPDWALRDVAGRVAAALRPAHAVEVFHGGLDLDTVVLTDEGRLVVTGFDLTAPDGVEPRARIRGDVAALADIVRALSARSRTEPPVVGRGWTGFDDLLAELGVVGLPANPISPLIELGTQRSAPCPDRATAGTSGVAHDSVGERSVPRPVSEGDATRVDHRREGGEVDATSVWDRSEDAAAPGESAPPAREDPGSRVPFVITVIVLGSAAPVLTGGILVLLVLPLLATIGDLRRRGLGRFGATRFLRHLVTSLMRALPAIGLTALLLLVHRAVVGADHEPVVAVALLRLTGIIAAILLLGALRGRRDRFPVRDGLDRMTSALRADGRIGERTIAVWIVLLALIVIGLWLEPTPFPFP